MIGHATQWTARAHAYGIVGESIVALVITGGANIDSGTVEMRPSIETCHDRAPPTPGGVVQLIVTWSDTTEQFNA